MLLEALNNRKDRYTVQLGKLAYEKLTLQKRIDEISNSIRQLEGAQIENEQAIKDAVTQESIDKASKEKSNA